MNFWLYCHGCHTQEETDFRSAWRFIVEHQPHATLITRILSDQLGEWEKTLVSETEQFLKEAK